MAEKQEQQEQRPKYKSLIDKLQTAGIAIGLILGLRQPPAPGSEEEKRVPSWVMASFDSWTHADEELFNEARYSHPHPDFLEIEGIFRERMIQDGYRENKYRSLLAGYRRTYKDELRNPAPKNDGADRLVFEKLTLRDSCLAFFDELINAVNLGGTDDDIYRRQRRSADLAELLVRKNILQKMRDHKLLTLLLFFCTVISTVSLAFWILRKIITRIVLG